MTHLTIYEPNIIRQYNWLTYTMGYLIGLLIVITTIGLHIIDRQIEIILIPLVASVIFYVVDLFMPAILSPGG